MTEYEQKVTRTLYWLTAASHRDALLSSSRGGTRIDWWPEYTLKHRQNGFFDVVSFTYTGILTLVILFQVLLSLFVQSCGFTCTGTREQSQGRSTGPDRWQSAGKGRAHTAAWWSDTRHWWQRETSREMIWHKEESQLSPRVKFKTKPLSVTCPLVCKY